MSTQQRDAEQARLAASRACARRRRGQQRGLERAGRPGSSAGRSATHQADAQSSDAPHRRGHQPRRSCARSRTTSPSRPLGRKIRIRMRIEKARMSLYSAPKAPPVSSEQVGGARRPRAARARGRRRIAPGMLPMPPSTAAVKAFSPGMKPVYGLIRLYWTPNSTPAPPPIAPPIRKVSEMIRLTLMPMRRGRRLVLGHRADRPCRSWCG